MRKRWIELLVLLALCAGLFAATRPEQPEPNPAIDALIARLQREDWPTVASAASRLESYGHEALPALIQLLDNDQLVRLANTDGLVYPGSEFFPGKGTFCPYDLDRISVRAGWVLESLTFCDFGFRGYPGWLRSERFTRERQASEEWRAYRAAAIQKAQKWWQEAGPEWRRVDGLEQALVSGSMQRRDQALGALMGGDEGTAVEGLTRDVYLGRIQPHILALRREPRAASRAAALYPPIERIPLGLSAHGISPGMPVTNARRIAAELPGQSCAAALVDKWDGHIFLIGEDDRRTTWMVIGDQLEIDGRVVARVGDRVPDGPALPRPYAVTSTQRLYPTHPELIISVDEGLIQNFIVYPPEPAIEPWKLKQR